MKRTGEGRTAATGSRPTGAEKEVVDLSENTCVPTPPVNTIQQTEQVGHGDTQENVLTLSIPVHKEDNDGDVVAHRFLSLWGLRNDLHICSFRACKELISHLATPAKEEVLSGLSNVEVVRRAYQSLRRSVLSHGELLKRHEQLNREHLDLYHHNETQLKELNRERKLVDILKDMEKERDDWRQIASDQGCEALVKHDTPDKLQQRSVKCIFIGYPKETMGYYFYFPPEKIVVVRYAEFFEKNLITQEVSRRAIDLEEIQDEDTSPFEITSKIPIGVEGFEPPQKEVIPIR
nr:zinc finger, CCHC-type [Tanacetum cinerariifolium]